MSVLANTRELLQSQAQCHSAVIVALDGKDSLCVIDLCMESFKRVEAFTMTYCRGTERFKQKAEYVKARWGIDLKEVDHFGAIQHLNRGDWCIPRQVDGPKTMAEAYEQQRKEYGIPLVATGSRMSESLGRRQCIKRDTWPGWHPIAEWRKSDVLSYLHARAIPLPEGEASMQGVSMHRSCIEEMYRSNRGDYELLRQRFPLVEAVVKRGEWYGEAKETQEAKQEAA